MQHIVLSFLFYNILLIIFYLHYKRGNYKVRNKNLLFYTILLIAFGTYGGGEGDYLHYKKAVESIHSMWDVHYYTGMEMRYYYLAYLLDGSYNLWRFVIFSVQFIGLGWLLYKAKLNTYLFFLAFTSLFLVISVYGRVYWGVIYYFMGLYLLIEKQNPLYLIPIALSFVSHTSNLILIALLPLAFFDLKKWHFILIIALFGSIIAMFNDYFNLFLEGGVIEGTDYLHSKVNNYSNNTSFASSYWGNSIGEKVIFILRHIPLILILFMLLKIFIITNNRIKQIYKPVRRVVNVYFGLNIVAIIFLFADLRTGTYFYRVLAMTFFPVTLILPYIVEKRYIRKRTFKVYIFLFLFATEANYLKDIYYAYVAGI